MTEQEDEEANTDILERKIKSFQQNEARHTCLKTYIVYVVMSFLNHFAESQCVFYFIFGGKIIRYMISYWKSLEKD